MNEISTDILKSIGGKAQGYRLIYQHGKDGSIRVTEPYTYPTIEQIREDYIKAGHHPISIVKDKVSK